MKVVPKRVSELNYLPHSGRRFKSNRDSRHSSKSLGNYFLRYIDATVTVNISYHLIRATALHATMNHNCPSIWINFNFQIICNTFLGSKLIKEISHCTIILAAIQEIFFSKRLTKFREIFLRVKLSTEVHEWCTSRVQWTCPCINSHTFWWRLIPALEVIGETSRRRRNMNLSRLLETLVLVSSDSALVSTSFGVGYQKIEILYCEIGKLK